MRQPRYEIRPVEVGGRTQWHWRLRATNGEVVCSGENYKSKNGATQGVEGHRRNALRAVVVVLDEIDNQRPERSYARSAKSTARADRQPTKEQTT